MTGAAGDLRLLPAGEQGLVVELGAAIDPALNERVRRLAHALAARLPGDVLEVVPAYRSLLVLFDPLHISRERLAAEIEALLLEPESALVQEERRVVTIPVCYGGECGPDLDAVATHCRLTPQEVVALHGGSDYLVHMLGFTPGFPYLGGLDARLSVPRLATPRTRVPAGSVALAAGQTGIYPVESPGGWRLIGRTPLRLFDPASAEPFLLSAGDLLRFRAIAHAEYLVLRAPGGGGVRLVDQAAHSLAAGPAISVLKPGLLTTVQDAGRPGYRKAGMPVAGAIDACAYAAANSLAGNAPGAAALELTLAGPTLRFEADAYVAIAGAPMQATLDGAPFPPWSAAPVRAGSVLAFGAASEGVRACLAVRGGIDVPLVLGSRSTYMRAAVGGLGGRALRKGDVLPVGAQARGARDERLPPRRLSARFVQHRYPAEVSLRVLLGPQDDLFTAGAVAELFGARWTVTPRNDRMGYRLAGPRLAHAGSAELISDALSPGAIQVPADGQPIVLAVDAQTTGGYPKIGWVIGPDLGKLAQARAGATLQFVRCTDAEAVAALRAERALRDEIGRESLTL